MSISFRDKNLLLIVLGAVLLVQMTSLKAGYCYDDVEAILENPDLVRMEALPDLFRTNYWGADRNIGLYRPLVQVSYMLEGVTVGWNPMVSHGINLALHLITVALLFLFLRRLLISVPTAAWASIAFGVHPALLDASVWISGRTDVMSALFMLLALHGALTARSRGEGFVGWATISCAVTVLLGLFSKEMAVTTPLLILLLPGRRHWRLMPAIGGAFVIYLIFRTTAVEGVLPSWAPAAGVALEGRDLFERVCLGTRALMRLAAMLILPIGLAGDHRGHAWAQPDALVGLTGVAAVFVYVWVVYRGLRERRRDETLSFFILGSALTWLPVQQIVPIGAVMAERFNYTPAMFILPLVGILLYRWLSERWPGPLRGLAVVSILGLAIVTLVRMPIYTDRGTYDRDVLLAYPEDHRAWNNLGVYLFLPLQDHEWHDPDYEAADEAFAEAMRILPGYRRGRLNRVRAALESDAHGLPVDFAKAESWITPLVRRNVGDAHYLLGKLLHRQALKMEPGDERKEHARMAGDAFQRAGVRMKEEGRHPHRQAQAWKEAGRALRDADDLEGTIEVWKKALSLNPTIGSHDAMRRVIDGQ